MQPPSSAAVSTRVTPGVCASREAKVRAASRIAATPAFMSEEPRPYSRSPSVSPAKGSFDHARAPSATVSRCPVRQSGALASLPPARATTLVRPGAYSWYSVRKPHCSSSSPACRAQSRSPPGGLMVSNASRSRVRATASFALMSKSYKLAVASRRRRPAGRLYLLQAREKALALLADDGDADRPLIARVRSIGDHIERAEERFQRRRFVALEPGVELLGRDVEEARQAVAPSEGLLGAAQRRRVAGALIHVRRSCTRRARHLVRPARGGAALRRSGGQCAAASVPRRLPALSAGRARRGSAPSRARRRRAAGPRAPRAIPRARPAARRERRRASPARPAGTHTAGESGRTSPPIGGGGPLPWTRHRAIRVPRYLVRYFVLRT